MGNRDQYHSLLVKKVLLEEIYCSNREILSRIKEAVSNSLRAMVPQKLEACTYDQAIVQLEM